MREQRIAGVCGFLDGSNSAETTSAMRCIPDSVRASDLDGVAVALCGTNCGSADREPLPEVLDVCVRVRVRDLRSKLREQLRADREIGGRLFLSDQVPGMPG